MLLNASDRSLNEVGLLDLYRRSIPSEFDLGLLDLQRKLDLKWQQSVDDTTWAFQIAKNAIQGNYSRIQFEELVRSLAEKNGLKSGYFASGGGTFHLKISTKDMVLTFHTLGDDEGNLSRYTKYKEILSKNNPEHPEYSQIYSVISREYEQGTFLIDDDIGAPEILDSEIYFDTRTYYTICIPRFLHQRNDVKLIVPSKYYLANSIVEFNLNEIRTPGRLETEITLLSENKMERKKLSLKDPSENEIVPKKVDTERKQGQQEN